MGRLTGVKSGSVALNSPQMYLHGICLLTIWMGIYAYLLYLLMDGWEYMQQAAGSRHATGDRYKIHDS